MASKEIKVQGLTLFVTDEHIYHRGEFIFHCRELNLSEIVLKDVTTIKEALELSAKAIEVHLQNKMTALTRLQIKVLGELDK